MMLNDQNAYGKHRVSFATVGCRLNQAEAEAARDEFLSKGWQIVDFGETAELVMINTCTVTGRADRSSRQLIHRARRDNPGALVVAAGCFAASHANELALESEADLILGVNEKARPFDFIPASGRPDKPLIHIDEVENSVKTAVGTRVSGRSRAFLKVQDGCDRACAYCAVTLVRGPSRSAPLDEIKAALYRIIAAGYEEIVFTGVDLTSWGRDLNGKGGDFIDLVSLAAEMGIPRVRVSSLEPWELSPQRIQRLAAIMPWCEHLHISLQSADPQLLESMNRPTDLGRLREALAELIRLRPRATLGADVIAGFPGERPDAFERTLRFLDDGPLHYLHVFPFSPRPGTPAAKLPGALDRETIHRRAKALRDAGRKRRRAHLAEMTGTEDELLIEENGRAGYTRSYLRATLTEGKFRPRTRVPVTLIRLDDNDDFLHAKANG